MNKSSIASTAGIGLCFITLLSAPAHAGSKNQEQAMGLELDIVAAAAIATDSIDARVMIDSENREIELKIDTSTGEIISQEMEGIHKSGSIAHLDNTLSMAEAITIVKAVAHGEVVEAELEGLDEELIWELKLIGDDKGEYRVDANSGELLP